MLFDLRAGKMSPRLFAVKETSVGGASVTLSTGGDGVVGATCGAAGISALPLRDPFSRVPVVVASKGTADIAADGAAYLSSAPTASTLTVATHSGGGGVGDNGTAYVLACGWDSRDTMGIRPRGNAVKGRWNDMCLVGLKIDGITATPLVLINSKYATVARTTGGAGAGDYTITLRNLSIGTPVHAVATAISAVKSEIGVQSETAESFRVIGTQGGAAADFNFYVIVAFTPRRMICHGKNNPVLVAGMRKPRLIATQYTSALGAPTLAVGDEVVLADNGVGDITETFTTKYKFVREPIVVLTPDAAGFAQLATDAASTGFQVLTFNAGGAAADMGVHAIVLGSDDSTEY